MHNYYTVIIILSSFASRSQKRMSEKERVCVFSEMVMAATAFLSNYG